MAMPERGTIYNEDGSRRNVYDRDNTRSTGWVIGGIIVLALIVIAYFVFASHPAQPTSDASNVSPPLTAPATAGPTPPADTTAPMTSAPVTPPPASSAPATTPPAATSPGHTRAGRARHADHAGRPVDPTPQLSAEADKAPVHSRPGPCLCHGHTRVPPCEAVGRARSRRQSTR